MEESEYVNAYAKFRAELAKVTAMGETVPYDWVEEPTPVPGIWMMYFMMLDDFSRELANVINQFLTDIEKLSAWEKVLIEYPKEDQFELVYEFIEPLGTICLNLPYAIRSRFIFAVAHLSHQANMAILGKNWKEDLPKDDEIYFEEMDKYAAPWKSYQRLKPDAERLSNRAYKNAVNHFREKYHHRHPCHIEFGLSESVKRIMGSGGKVSYGIGGSNPMLLKDIIPVLKDQRATAVECFKSFQGLVQEQIGKILSSSK